MSTVKSAEVEVTAGLVAMWELRRLAYPEPAVVVAPKTRELVKA